MAYGFNDNKSKFDLNNILSNLAGVETGANSTKYYSKGSLLVWNNVLYITTKIIPSSTRLEVGTNISSITLDAINSDYSTRVGNLEKRVMTLYSDDIGIHSGVNASGKIYKIGKICYFSIVKTADNPLPGNGSISYQLAYIDMSPRNATYTVESTMPKLSNNIYIVGSAVVSKSNVYKTVPLYIGGTADHQIFCDLTGIQSESGWKFEFAQGAYISSGWM